MDPKDIRTREGSGEIDFEVLPEQPSLHWEYIGQGKRLLVDPSPHMTSLAEIQERVKAALLKALETDRINMTRIPHNEPPEITTPEDYGAGYQTPPKSVYEPTPKLESIKESVDHSPDPSIAGEFDPFDDTHTTEQSSVQPLTEIQSPKIANTPIVQEDAKASSGTSSVTVGRRQVKFVLPPVKQSSHRQSRNKPYHLSPTVNRRARSAMFPREDAAVLHIQSVWRGFMTRRRIRLSKLVHNIFDPYFKKSVGRHTLSTGWTISRLPSFGVTPDSREISFSN